jgi:hypothetical protein
MTPPMLTTFASPIGGVGLPWDGPAGVLINPPRMPTAFAMREAS